MRAARSTLRLMKTGRKDRWWARVQAHANGSTGYLRATSHGGRREAGTRCETVLLGILALACTLPAAHPVPHTLKQTPRTYTVNDRRVVTMQCASLEQGGWRGMSPEQHALIAGCHKNDRCDIVCDPHPELLPPPKRIVYRACVSDAQRAPSVSLEKEEEVTRCSTDAECEVRCEQ